ncbi:alkaline phosphatase family protein [Limnoglobus roseus]|uniref:Alkaline phosphatase family protein n=1 Tax=Limnoglobus roseus TaxID=2598579 RepID=A0A5C1ARS9_9BACT|nr:alkaline phosphatase family protein [Limnoglobus roseus]QEL19578.1 alkaline phosphatase family protein [Limnoglobus roseus]
MPRLTLLVLLLGFGLLAVSTGSPALPAIPQPVAGKLPVKLAVLIVFDQMRGDYVDKWRPLFGPRGFRRIQKDGAWFPNCFYPYAGTSTGPGHSALLSGATLDKTGIIENEWYDRKAAALVYCAGSDRYAFVPPLPAALPTTSSKADVTPRKPKPVGHPDFMLAETVADVLKRETAGKGKVFGLSLKDRSAILPTGKRPDGAFWFNGQFVTSTYYTDTLPAWVSEFNRKPFKGGRPFADQWFGRDWVRSRGDLNYSAFSGPDEVSGEGRLNGRGVTFPHMMTGGKDTLGKEYYEALANSPMGNELLLAFAKACVRAEQLGQDDVPDLLVVSFSSNDVIGHTFGPDSQEVLDVTLRSDEILADFLEFLDEAVGPGNYAVTVSADHGVGPLPEVAAATLPEARNSTRVDLATFLTAAEHHLSSTFGPPQGPPGKPEDLADEVKALKGQTGLWIESAPTPWVYLNRRQTDAKNVKTGDVATSLVEWLKRQPAVQTAYTADEIETAPHPDDTLKFVRRSFVADRAGDVYVLLKPYYLFADRLRARGTGHGTPYDYDRHVPLLVYGPGLAVGRRSEGAVPQQVAAIVSRFLDLPRPRDAAYDLPRTLLGR